MEKKTHMRITVWKCEDTVPPKKYASSSSSSNKTTHKNEEQKDIHLMSEIW